MKRPSSSRPGLIWIGFGQSSSPPRPLRPPLWTTDLQLLAVLLHLAQFLRGLPLQGVELVLQPAAVHAFLLHAAAQRGQLHRCGAQVKGQWQRRDMMSVCVEGERERVSPTGVFAEGDVPQLLRQPLFLWDQL